MTVIKIGERTLAPVAVHALSAEEWVRREGAADGYDRLYFRVGDQVHEALFEGKTLLTRAIHDAIAKGALAIEYAGESAVFLRSEDMASASLLRSAAAETED